MKRFSIGLALLALLLAACGGDNGSSTTLPTAGLPSNLDTAACAKTAAAIASAAGAIPQALTGAAGNLGEAVDQLKTAVGTVPDDIKADLQTVADGYEHVAEILKDANLQPGQVPSADVIAQLATAGQSLNTDAFKGAVERVTTWFRDQCGK